MSIQTNTELQNEKKINIFITIAGILIGVFCGVVLTVALQYGATKQKVEENTEDILSLKKRSVDYVYIQDLIQSNYLLVDILKATPNSEQMDAAMKEWKDFQLSTVRRANPTRGGSGGTNGGASE